MENGVGSELCDDGNLRMEIDVKIKKVILSYTEDWDCIGSKGFIDLL